MKLLSGEQTAQTSLSLMLIRANTCPQGYWYVMTLFRTPTLSRMETPGFEHKDTAWNPSLENILKKEAEQAEGLYWLHNRSQAITARKNDWLMIPSIIISGVNGFLIGSDVPIPSLALGLVSILVGTLSTITTYFRYSQKAEGHRISALLYLKIYKSVEIELAKPVDQRADADEMLKSLKDQISRVVETAPIPDPKAIEEYRAKFSHDPVSHPLVANGLSEVKIYNANAEVPTLKPTVEVN